MTIRPATEQDIPAITAIYNEVVANSNAVWTEKPDSEAERLAWMNARRALGYPVLVATDGTAVIGYGTFGDFRAWPGYRYSVEHSVYIHADHRGRGLGRVIIDELVSAAGRARQARPDRRHRRRQARPRSGCMRSWALSKSRACPRSAAIRPLARSRLHAARSGQRRVRRGQTRPMTRSAAIASRINSRPAPRCSAANSSALTPTARRHRSAFRRAPEFANRHGTVFGGFPGGDAGFSDRADAARRTCRLNSPQSPRISIPNSSNPRRSARCWPRHA